MVAAHLRMGAHLQAASAEAIGLVSAEAIGLALAMVSA